MDVDSVDIHDQGGVSDARPSGGIVAEIKGIFGMHDDAHGYSEGLRRGHVLLTAKVDEDQADEAIRVLESTGPVDFDRKQAEWRNTGWTAPVATTGDRAPDDKIDIVKEKRVEVERRAVDRPITGADDAFRERTVEMRETGEEAVVGKETVVTEEVSIKKDVGQRTEEVRDTVRHTEVDVERIAGDTRDRLAREARDGSPRTTEEKPLI